MVPDRDGWWHQAHCRTHDPEWWADNLSMRPAAVAICIACPVRAACRADALRQHGQGVIRAGLLLTRGRHGGRVTSLICSHCATRPVVMLANSHGVYCGRCLAGRLSQLDHASVRPESGLRTEA